MLHNGLYNEQFIERSRIVSRDCCQFSLHSLNHGTDFILPTATMLSSSCLVIVSSGEGFVTLRQKERDIAFLRKLGSAIADYVML